MPNRKMFDTNEDYNKYQREYYKKNKDKLREYKRLYNQKWRKEFGYKNEEISKKRYPEKEIARRLLRYAVKKGYIKKLPCS